MSWFGRHGQGGRIAHLIAAGTACLALAACANGDMARKELASTAAHDATVDSVAATQPAKQHNHISRARDAAALKHVGYSAVGMASWYGADFHGRRTADGEAFDMNSLTAAHPTLPLPCRVRVTNLANRRSIVVRVNDRGPFVHHRLIDVSAKTAKVLGFYTHGLAKVKIDYIGRAPPRRGASTTAMIE